MWCLPRPAPPFLAALFAFSVPAAAQVAPRGLETADSIVSEWIESARIPGAVLLVAHEGDVLLERAYGYAQLFAFGGGQYPAADSAGARERLERLGSPVPMTPATVFDLASVTKVMATTMAVMLLVDRGELDLDAPLHTYLPDFRGEDKDRITLRHLLTHRSGLLQWVPVYYHASWAGPAYAFIRDQPLGWPVGEGRHYSDLGFMLLGLVVERVSGLPLDVFLRDELYEPLGLERTGFRQGRPTGAVPAGGPYAATSHGNPFERRMVHDPDFGYRIPGDPDAWSGWRRRTLVGEVNDGNAFHAFGGLAGHAGLFSTAGELRVLLELLRGGGELGGRRYVRSEIVATFLRAREDGQALGWQSPPYAPQGAFAHTGFTGTMVMGVPSRGLTIVLLTNRQNVGVDETGYYPDVGPLQQGVVEAVTGGGR